MLDFEDDASKREKCYTTIGQLPAFIDPKQPPTKRSPFSAILGHPFVHTVEVILPKDILSYVQPQLQNLRYARVFMSLSSLLEGDFFNTYIKTGNILMISEGRSGSDSVFTLKDGILKLELSKEIFERTGLTGKPVRSGGRKHAKERFIVEINLRLPSMLHGKKGFERIVWAFKNVLNQSVAWLFFDLTTSSGGVSEDDPSLKGNQPQIINCQPIITEHSNILVPPLPGPEITDESREAAELEDHCNELSEWLAMVSLESPRVSVYDDVDPYLCRYSVPVSDNAKSTNLVSLKWHGLVPSLWIIELLVAILKETAPKSIAPYAWFALSASALGREAVEARDGYTVMVLPTHVPKQDVFGVQTDSSSKGGGRHFICWEYVGASIL
ncbi:ribonuclease P protein subunit p40 [Aspergillus tubingensis]|uniref:Ribonuclease P protein subunit p40 n=1 Tax=Aspergillus tubingensis TaxID=5068 RepID=A0A9W6AU62_ASPTU|nr:ribonuclease P protein subunit p40 [Aspergillus tubingensis]